MLKRESLIGRRLLQGGRSQTLSYLPRPFPCNLPADSHAFVPCPRHFDFPNLSGTRSQFDSFLEGANEFTTRSPVLKIIDCGFRLFSLLILIREHLFECF